MLELTAKAVGRSIGATCNLRTRYCKVARHEREAPRPKREPRNRANMTMECEAQILDGVLDGVIRGGGFRRSRKKSRSAWASQSRRMLARNGWRKLAPDTAHPQGNPAAPEDWKKNSKATGAKS